MSCTLAVTGFTLHCSVRLLIQRELFVKVNVSLHFLIQNYLYLYTMPLSRSTFVRTMRPYATDLAYTHPNRVVVNICTRKLSLRKFILELLLPLVTHALRSLYQL